MAWHRLTFAVGAISVFAVIVRFIYRGYQQRRFYRNLPGPPHSWLLGHLKAVGDVAGILPSNCHPQAYYTELARRHNLDGIFYLDLWPIGPPSVILTRPELCDQPAIIKCAVRHPVADDTLTPVVGHGGIANSNGPLWKKSHTTLLPAFSWANIRSLASLMAEECMPFRSLLNKLSETGEVFSLEDVAAKLVFDIIFRIIFNFPLNAQTDGSQDLNDLRELMAFAESQSDPAVMLNPFARLKIWWRRKKISKQLDISMTRKIRERFVALPQDEIISSRRSAQSILDLMLREHLPTPSEASKERPNARNLSEIDEAVILSNIKNLLVGGHGTTTDTICFSFMLLSEAPAVVETMLQEHRDILGSDFDSIVSSIANNPEKLQTLPYTEAVIKEILRLFPIGFTVRQAAPQATVSHNGETFPIDNGLMVCMNGHDLHYNPQFFPNPSEFSPERWLGPKEIPRSQFRTFGRGLRSCMGENLAMNELKIIFSLILVDFSFKCYGLAPNTKTTTSYTDLDQTYGDVIFQELGLEAKPRGGMMMTVRRRL
ncbi:putative sterigmatocystin biosynthesis P450 monooxygenase stcS [Colletotrichum tropicale]|nr:putative sterigmatocystin biosynthesis P450 monooxygenase stcS [Colletotrichum tropicale]